MSSTQVPLGWSRSSAGSRRTSPASRSPEPVEAVPLERGRDPPASPRATGTAPSSWSRASSLDRDVLERELEPLGDSLLVVGDATALKAHVHTDDPGSALRAGTALGVIERVEIANMHLQSAQREERLSQPRLGRSPDRGRRGRHRRGQPPTVREHGRDRDRRRRRDDEPVDRGLLLGDRERARARRPSCWRTTTTSSSRRARRRGSRTCPFTSSRRARFRRASSDARVRPAGGCGGERAGDGRRGYRESRPAASRLHRERSASTDCRSSAAPISASSAATRSRGGTSFDTVAASVVDRLLARAARRPDADHRRGRARARPAARAGRRTAPRTSSSRSIQRPAALSAVGIGRVTP